MPIVPGWLVLAALLTGAACENESARMAAQASSPVTVVAELFTSEGCSSCPAADTVLTQLIRQQPLAGVEIVALAEHVDYWDRLGWRDRFSSAAFSARQSEYDARVFRTNRIYTPQLVVDGQYEAVGSDSAAIRAAISRSARNPKAEVTIRAAGEAVDVYRATVDVRVVVPAAVRLRGPADVLVAIVEDDLSTDVRRGENGGRTLRHNAVVRSLTTVGAIARDDPAFTATVLVPFGSDWRVDQLRAIAIVQERETRHIVGAAATRLLVQR